MRNINWGEVFGFTKIFRSFRMAIQPSKLFLAFAAITLVFITGWVMDLVWCLGNEYVYTTGANNNPARYRGEIFDHFAKTGARFDRDKEAWEEGRIQAAARLCADMQRERKNLQAFDRKLEAGHFRDAFRAERKKVNETEAEKKFKPQTAAAVLKEAEEKDKSWSALLSDAKDMLSTQVDKLKTVLADVSDEAEKLVANDQALKTDEQKDKAGDAIDRAEQRADQAITEIKVAFAAEVRKIEGEGIFGSLLDYELACVRNAVLSAVQLNFCGGLEAYRQGLAGRAVPPQALAPLQQTGLAAGRAMTPQANACGFAYWVLMGAEGGRWFLSEHWVYAAIFLLVCMGIVALFGGAVNRIAALHFAREEKISMFQALKFALSKFLSFFTAPLLPIAIILVMAGLMALGGLIGSIPYVGEILMAVLFGLAIIAGLLIAFLLVGLVGGVGLMYPTIAVEGSDSFDAISRSFSYAFARPWRALLYAAVAAVYGAITYLFVRLFAFLALSASHRFVKWGVWGGGSRLDADADRLDLLWTKPQFGQLFGPWSWQAMDGTEKIAAFIIGVWVFLVAGMVAAYLLSYAACATTSIYFLLRRKVDATDLDDVYVEEIEEAPPETPGAEPAEPQPEAEAPKAEEKAKKTRRAKKPKAEESTGEEDKPEEQRE